MSNRLNEFLLLDVEVSSAGGWKPLPPDEEDRHAELDEDDARRVGDGRADLVDREHRGVGREPARLPATLGT